MVITSSEGVIWDFDVYARLRGCDLPEGVRIEAIDRAGAYAHSNSVYLLRNGNSVELKLSCCYHCAGSLSGVRLQEFLPSLMLHLRSTRRVKLEAFPADDAVSQAFLGVSAGFPAAVRLGSAYRELSRLLESKHATAIDELSPSLSRRQAPTRRRKRPDAFICHDSRDKARIVRPIVAGLSSLMCSVWYDEFSLRAGARLRESIERGLKTARKCVLVLSPRFLANTGWTRAEFNAVFSRELLHARDIIIPVWAGVTESEVFEYCPNLTNRFAVHWRLGVDEVVFQLYRAIRGT